MRALLSFLLVGLVGLVLTGCASRCPLVAKPPSEMVRQCICTDDLVSHVSHVECAPPCEDLSHDYTLGAPLIVPNGAPIKMPAPPRYCTQLSDGTQLWCTDAKPI